MRVRGARMTRCASWILPLAIVRGVKRAEEACGGEVIAVGVVVVVVVWVVGWMVGEEGLRTDDVDVFLHK